MPAKNAKVRAQFNGFIRRDAFPYKRKKSFYLK